MIDFTDPKLFRKWADKITESVPSGNSMIVCGGYSLTYDKSNNKITITLPQTFRTVVNTISPVEDRRVDVNDSELAALLSLAMRIFYNNNVCVTGANAGRKDG